MTSNVRVERRATTAAQPEPRTDQSTQPVTTPAVGASAPTRGWAAMPRNTSKKTNSPCVTLSPRTTGAQRPTASVIVHLSLKRRLHAMNTTPIDDCCDRAGNAGTGPPSLRARERVHPEDVLIVVVARSLIGWQFKVSKEAASPARGGDISGRRSSVQQGAGMENEWLIDVAVRRPRTIAATAIAAQRSR